MAALTRWCLRHRLVVILCWLTALVGTAVTGSLAGDRYSETYAFPDTDSTRATRLLQDAFPQQLRAADTVVWRSESAPVTAADVRLRMRKALGAVEDVPGVTAVISPYGESSHQSSSAEVRPNAERGETSPDGTGTGGPQDTPSGSGTDGTVGSGTERVEAGAAQDPPSQQISEDRTTAFAQVIFTRNASDLEAERVRQVVRAAKSAESPTLQVELGGSAMAMADKPPAHLSEIVGLAAAAVVLLLAFGSVTAMLLPLVTALVSVGMGTIATGLLSHVMHVAEFAPMLGVLIGLGVGIDYALFIVTRYRKGLKQQLSPGEAVERALSTSGRAVVFAGGTVCMALLGVLVLRLDFLNGVALAASLTVVLTVLASVTLLPALLATLGERVLSRRERRRLAEREPAPDTATGLSARWSAYVERHPRLLAVIGAAAMMLLALPTSSLHLGTADQGNEPASSTARKAYDLLADGFGSGSNGPLQLVAEMPRPQDRAALDGLVATLRTTNGVASVHAVPAGPVSAAGTEGAVRAYEKGESSTRGGAQGTGEAARGRASSASGEGGASGHGTLPRSGAGGGEGRAPVGVVKVVPTTAPQEKATDELIDRLRHEVIPDAEAGTTLTVHVGGVTAVHKDFASVVVGKLPLFLGVVVALGFAVLLLAFRGFGVPLTAAVMNMLASASSFGIVVAVFQWGWGTELLGVGRPGPIEPFLPVIMLSILFGVSMDYQVFLASRIHEEWIRTRDNRVAVRVGLAETSRVINSAAAIMICVFAAFVLSGDRVIAMFGVGLAGAVALDAFVLRTLLVPALMHLLGRANWWLPRWFDRRLPRLSVEGIEVFPEGSMAKKAALAKLQAGGAAAFALPGQRGPLPPGTEPVSVSSGNLPTALRRPSQAPGADTRQPLVPSELAE